MNKIINNDIHTKTSFIRRLNDDLYKNKLCYAMVLPAIVFYAVFAYIPMYGAIIAFKEYTPSLGIMGSPWVGFEPFKSFFDSFYFARVVKNTIVISLATLVFGFPAPIILALLLNGLKMKRYVRVVQSLSYIPHFISLVVICGMIKQFTLDSGLINDIISLFGGTRVSMLNNSSYFVPVYVISGIWQEIGWGSIVYLAALTMIDHSLYEAASIDGAGRFKQVFIITIPGIMPTIITMLLLKIGNILNVGYEKIILLYNPSTYETADVISSFVYRKGLQEFDWSFSAAVGLFNSAINLLLLLMSNFFSKKLTGSSLW